MTCPRFTLFVIGLALTVGRAAAADNTWTDAAGGFAWNTTSGNWTSPPIWNNADIDDAIFGSTGAGAITVASAITVRGMDFTANGYTLTGSSALTLTSGSTGSLSVGEIQVAPNVSATINAPIAGSIAMTKTNTGTLSLGGTNTYSGGTTISAGSLVIGTGGTSGSIAGNVVDNGSLAFNRSDTPAFSGTISGTGAVVQSGSGTLTLSGTNTYSGGTDINAGILSLGSSGAIGTAGSIYLSGGTLQYSANNTTDYSARFSSSSTNYSIDTNGQIVFFASPLSGTAGLIKLGQGELYLTGANTYSGGTTISGGALFIGFGGTSGSITGNVIDNAYLYFDRSDTPTLSGNVSGTGAVVQAGNGTVTLTGNNTYTGGTYLDYGVLSLGSSGAIGTAGAITFEGGTLQYSASNQTDYSSRFVNLGSNYSIDTNGQNVTFASVLSGSGGLTKIGAGTLTLTAQNTFTGGTFVNGGTLLLGTAAANQIPTGGNVTVASGAVFDLGSPAMSQLSNAATPVGTITLNGGTLREDANGSQSDYYGNGLAMTGGTLDFTQTTASSFGLLLNGGVTTNASGTTALWNGSTSAPGHVFIQNNTAGPLTITVAAGTTASGIDLDSSLSLYSPNAGASWIKAGPGVMRMTEQNYSLALIVAAGSLRVDTVSMLNNLTGSIGDDSLTLSGGTLLYGGPTATSAANSLTLGGNNGTIGVMSAATTLTLANTISGAGSLTKAGLGALILTNSANSFLGGVNVMQGTLSVAADNLLGASQGPVRSPSARWARSYIPPAPPRPVRSASTAAACKPRPARR